MLSPTAAERARTVLAVAPVLEVTTFGVVRTVVHHAVDPDGRPLLLLPRRRATGRRSGAVPQPTRAVVHAAQLHVLHLPDRVRHRVRLCGTIGPVPDSERAALLRRGTLPNLPDLLDGHGDRAGLDGHRLLRVEAALVQLDGVRVPLPTYRAAAPDPLAPVEAAQLEELLRSRQDDLVWLSTLLGPGPTAGATRIAPVGLDRYGLTLRVTGPDGTADHRLAFPFAVDRSETLHRVLQGLVGAARTAHA